ncbi:MAG: MATE family efflux transporter [Dermatophilus congolensis]|nr:MATE family efflux transporter [Dermatophilus congolensis]
MSNGPNTPPSPGPEGVQPPSSALAREVWHLAFPAFLTLLAEPLFLLADSAIIGHLGTTPLAGLGVASSILATATGVYVFLAYATTAVVARRLGAGQRAEAISGGIDGLWLAILLGIVTGIGIAAAADPLIAAFGASPAATAQGVIYLRISAAGIPAMLIVLALTGLLRGMQDTRTPLISSTLAFGGNIVLNVLFVYGMGMGIGGAALGTVIAQTGLALGLGTVVLRNARKAHASLRPAPAGILSAAIAGAPLLVRTLALRATLLLTTWVAARLGDVPVAAYQVSMTIWTFLAFALDALAIAGQALVGQALGSGDRTATRALTRLLTRWSLGLGIITGLITAAVAPFVPALFTSDPAVRAALTAGLLVIALAQPVAAYAFLLDGVLIGAGDGRWLAATQVGLFVAYLPVALIVYTSRSQLQEWGAPAALAALWVGFALFMSARALMLGIRARGDAWMVTGA